MPMEMITTEPELERAGFYWRELDGVRALICAPLEQDGFTNGFSTRLGGTSPLPLDALNLAGFNEDAAENIVENRRRFLKLFAGNWSLAGGWQVHGADIRVVTEASEAQPPPYASGDEDRCDAVASKTENVLAIIKTADCVPILIGDTRTGAFAAVHAGWRGTLASIVTKTLTRMQQEFGVRASEVRVAIGSAAGVCCYEVGSEVIDAFTERFPATELFTPTREGHARIDLFKANREQLLAVGVEGERIHTSPFCTMCRNDLFFSYRREKYVLGKVGRLMSVIGKPSGKGERVKGKVVVCRSTLPTFQLRLTPDPFPITLVVS
jgi:YfiH family protein